MKRWWSSVENMVDDKARLQLGKVSMKNYKSYYGEVDVELSRDPSKTITVIEGGMGKGKTTFLGAIYWCLYGKEKPGATTNTDETIISNDIVRRLNVGDSDTLHVELSLYEDRELRYKIKRSLLFTKKSESEGLRHHIAVSGRLPHGISVEESVEYKELPRGENDWLTSSDPSRVKYMIERIFPVSLSSYFLFDAELLDSFFRHDRKNRVKSGIEEISGLPLIENAIQHISKAKNNVMDGIKDLKTDQAKNDLHHYRKEVEECTKLIEVSSAEMGKLETEIEGIDSFLRDHSEPAINAIQGQRDEIGKAKQEISQKIKKHRIDMNDWLLHSNIIGNLSGAMSASIDMCDVWEKEGKIPIAVSRLALKNILAGDPPQCICGASLGSGSEGRKHVEKILSEGLSDSAVIQSIATGRGHWADMLSEYDEQSKDLDRRRTERHNLRIAHGAKESEYKDLSRKLEVHDLEEVRRKSARRRDLMDKLLDHGGVKKGAENKLPESRRKLAEKEHELKKVVAKEKKYRVQNNMMLIAGGLNRLLSQCKADLIENMRDTVARTTTDYFLKLVPSDDFSKVEISHTYETSALGNDKKTKSLSAGQNCCLALSYIAAIREIADRNYFMVIDSPLHNISQPERVGIAKNLPAFLQGTQITMLVQDQEYVGKVIRGTETPDIESVRKTLIDVGCLWREYVIEQTKKSPDDVTTHSVIREREDGTQ